MSTNRVADMTVEELMTLIHQRVHLEVEEIMKQHSGVSRPRQRLTLDDFPVDDVGPWPEGLTLRREEMYDDDDY